MFVQLVWACQERTCFLVQQPDGSYQSVWNASPEQVSQYMAIINKQPTTPKEKVNRSALLSKIEAAPW